MKLIFLLQTLILANLVFGHRNCFFKSTPKDESILERLKRNPNRNLESITPQKIRIKFDFSALNSVQDPKTKDNIIKIVQFAGQFFQNLIKVKQPINTPIKIFKFNQNCSGFYNFSKMQMNTEYKDADLVIFVSHVHDLKLPYVAFASGCQQDANTGRNIFGVVSFNTFIAKPSSAYQFQYQFQTAIHELFHILVFDPLLFQFFVSSDGKIYDRSKFDFKNLVLKTPNVSKWVQNYYDCQTDKGMQLENNGSLGSLASHWEMSALYDDIMSPSGVDTLWSGVNNALLLDSGWYDVDLKFEDNLTWGKNKGCEFLKKDKCNRDKQFKEFCKGEGEYTTFSYHAKGKCQKFQWEPKCRVINHITKKINEVEKSTVCFDPSNYDPDGKYNEYYGHDSRAFLSTLKPISEKSITQACYKYKCTDDNSKIEVTFGQETLTCISNGEKLKSSSNLIDGELTCPDIKDFCGKQSLCPNYCSENGYCISGKCVCLNGFSGDDCKCEEGKVIQNGQCVNCSENCATCSSTDPKKCSVCKTGYFLKDQKCLPCKSPCKTCSTGEDTCLSCISNYYLQSNSCEKFICDSNCDVPEDNSKCKLCKSGKGLYSDGLCNLICSNNCKTCSEKADACTSCNVGNILFNQKCVCEDGYFMNQNNECEQCLPFCKECDNAQTCINCINLYEIDQNTKKCDICPKGNFLENGKCAKCSKNCFECQGSSTNCTKCGEFAKLSGQNGQQSCQCEQNFVYSSEGICTKCTVGCSLCEEINVCFECDPQYKLNESQYMCDSCNSGFEKSKQGTCECKQGEYMNDQNTCVSCDISCNGCERQKKSCDSSSHKLIYTISLIILLIITF